MSNANVLIVTDDTGFAGLLTACWQAQRKAPGITVMSSALWDGHNTASHDLIVVGPVSEEKLAAILTPMDSQSAVIVCMPGDPRNLAQLRKNYSRLAYIPLRENWSQTLLLIAGEVLLRADLARALRNAESVALQSQQHATLGRYMMDMKHSVNNALTSLLGNAELLLLEPGQLSSHSLAQIKTIHSMALRINEIMQRFSSLGSEMRDAENASQAETQEVTAASGQRS